MIRVAVTQRVSIVPDYGERRDCLDQNWTRFLTACGLVPILIPNLEETALELCESAGISGVILTGGNDLAAMGGDAPERDRVENALLDLAEHRGLPVAGVCRGMQLIQHRFGVPLSRVEGHVARCQKVRIEGKPEIVNSYHCFGSFETRPPLEVWAVAEDGVVEAIRHSAQRMIGMMWHPERSVPFSPADIQRFREFFGS